MSNPPTIDQLIARLTNLIGVMTEGLEDAYPDGVEVWHEELAKMLTRYHAAAALAGSGSDTLTPALQTAIKRDLAGQVGFLSKFAIEVKEGRAWQRGWNARAASYANGIKVPYWRGKTRVLPLPAMPAEGTQCYGNCGCSWEVTTVDEEQGDYDAYWRRSKDDSCQTCVQREADWSPVQIRGGVLQ